MWRIWTVISTISLALLAGSDIALAESCSAIQSQMRAAASASNSQTAQIRRQIAAIRGLERQRSCTAEKAAAGGFFNACRGLAQQRAEAERKLAAARGGGRSTASLQARYAALGCNGQKRQQRERLVRSDDAGRSGPKYSGGALYYCVRPADGYFFPAPHSQFGGRDYIERALDQCRFICKDPAMALYVLQDPELETEEMVSVVTNAPYKDLPTAFGYQTDGKQNSCSWSRYFARVNELRARRVTPRDLSNAIIPIPTFRPQATAPLIASANDEKAPEPDIDRKVRIVGPTYLPDGESEFPADRRFERNRMGNFLETLIRRQ